MGKKFHGYVKDPEIPGLFIPGTSIETDLTYSNKELDAFYNASGSSIFIGFLKEYNKIMACSRQ